MTLTVGSLFSGIGGIDLGLERAGMTVLWQAETDAYASRVLAKHWPGVPNHGDVTAIDWSTVARPDLLAGGYPCQPFSLAGTRQGTEDPRHLWPHFARAIRHLRPDWVLLENVPGHLTLGFGTVLADLAALGYDTEWECIPAAAVGAPHLRWRLFVVAYPGTALARVDGPDRAVADTKDGTEPEQPTIGDLRHEPIGARTRASSGARRWPATAGVDHARGGTCFMGEAVADTLRPGREVRETDSATHLYDWTVPQRCPWWDIEPDVGRVAHGVPSRMDRLRGLGNAVVPQVAECIGRRIVEADALEHQGAA